MPAMAPLDRPEDDEDDAMTGAVPVAAAVLLLLGRCAVLVACTALVVWTALVGCTVLVACTALVGCTALVDDDDREAAAPEDAGDRRRG